MRLGVSLIEGVDPAPPATVLAALDRFTARVAKPSMFPVWRSLSDPDRRHVSSELLDGLEARNVTPVIFLTSVSQDALWPSCGYEAILRGEQDEVIDGLARDLSAHHAIVRLDHEMNATGLDAPWQRREPALFRQAFSHVSDRIRHIAPWVLMHWCPMATRKLLPTLIDWFPGRPAVQLVGFDKYDSGARESLAVSWRGPLAAIRAFTSLPILVGEFGSARGPRGRGRWLRSLGEVRDVWGAIYFNLDMRALEPVQDGLPRDWRMGRGMERAFRELAA